MDQRRILFVSHSPVVSGAEAVLLELVKPFSGGPFSGASAFVFEAGPLKDRLAALGLPVGSSRFAAGVSGIKRDGSLLRAVPLAGRFLAITAEIARAAMKNDLIYANSQKAFILSAIASRIARRPLIWHLHDIPSREHFGKTQLKLQITLANACATRVIVPSTAVKDGFVAAGGRVDRVRVVPNGVSLPASDDRPKREIRAALGLPAVVADAPLVGVFSRLAAWKGQHVLIEALASLPDTHCIVAGTALFGEDAYAAELKALTARLGLEDRVHFLGHRSDVPALMRAVDVVVHPSTSPEPFGLTLVESALAGTPVVATATGAAPEILEGGKAGWLVPPGDPPATAAAIGTILSSPAEAAGRVAHAMARARTLYSAERMIGGVEDVIRELPLKRRRSDTAHAGQPLRHGR